MPTYEFICPEGHDFEKFFRSMGSAPMQFECPTCGASAERKVSGGSGLVFKGSGFYITDYGKDGKKDQRDREKANPAPASDSSSSSKSSASESAKSAPSSTTKSSSTESPKPAPKSSGE